MIPARGPQTQVSSISLGGSWAKQVWASLGTLAQAPWPREILVDRLRHPGLGTLATRNPGRQA